MNLRDWLFFKDHVMPAGAHPMLQSAILTAVDVFRVVASRETWVTSMGDSVHGQNSFHYWCMAVDLRTKHLEDGAEKRRVRDELALRLGPGWDVILEAENTPNEHLHVEWDAGRRHKVAYLESLQQDFYDQLEGDGVEALNAA